MSSETDDGLDAVAEVELLEDPRDVRLRGCFADHELFADLRIGEAAGEQVKHLALSRGQLGEETSIAGPRAASRETGLTRTPPRKRPPPQRNRRDTKVTPEPSWSSVVLRTSRSPRT